MGSWIIYPKTEIKETKKNPICATRIEKILLSLVNAGIMDTQDARLSEKKALAKHVLKKIPDKGVIGLGSGSTVNEVIRALAEDKTKREQIQIIPGSLQTKILLHEHGLQVADLWSSSKPLLVIDGTDQIDAKKNMIKGGGGALLREKILASTTQQYYILCDQSKHVNVLGGGTPLPVEVLPFGGRIFLNRVKNQGYNAVIRRGPRGNPFRTDNGNIIVDVLINRIEDPKALDLEFRRYPEVLATGLFYDMNPKVITFRDNKLQEY